MLLSTKYFFIEITMNFHPLRPFTTMGKHTHPLDKVAEINGLLSGIALFPQVVKVATTKTTEGLSISTFVFILMNSLIWILYARHRSLPQLLLSSLLNGLAAAILLTYIVIYP